MINKRIHYKAFLAYYEIGESLKDIINEDTIIVCIGTDKCIGDCLGPLVGTLLKSNMFPLPVYGTVSNPIHALNIDEKLNEIYNAHPNASIIGIDACLGQIASIGEIHTRHAPICPGRGVGKVLPDVGVASIVGIVESNSNADLFTSRTIRLSLILDMAKVMSKGLLYAYSLKMNLDYAL